MKTYREFYKRLIKSSRPGFLLSSWPHETDDLLREQGIEVMGSDHIQTSTAALLVYFAMRIRELEERITYLEKQ